MEVQAAKVLQAELSGQVSWNPHLSDSSIPLCCVIGSKLLNLSEPSPYGLYEGENDIYPLFTSDEMCCIPEEEQGEELK